MRPTYNQQKQKKGDRRSGGRR